MAARACAVRCLAVKPRPIALKAWWRHGMGLALLCVTQPFSYFAQFVFVLLLLWVNYSSMILLFGAAFTRAHLQARGRPVRPRATAICVHRQLIED